MPSREKKQQLGKQMTKMEFSAADTFNGRTQGCLVCQGHGHEIDYTRVGFEARSFFPRCRHIQGGSPTQDVVYLKITKHTA
jgi:hypothetical protein